MKIERVRDVGRLIRARRDELGWSQSELAERIESTRRWVSEIEQGKQTAEVGLVLAALAALGLEVRSGPAETVPVGQDSLPDPTPLSPSPSFDEILDRHVEGERRGSVRFLRTNR
ncbi:MAG: helix-turn-helix domain-containing protein [Thioalkalivibrio sp.]|nr:helix-turn-helix domain-containing protein [Thioalkalivibrio sp.]